MNREGKVQYPVKIPPILQRKKRKKKEDDNISQTRNAKMKSHVAAPVKDKGGRKRDCLTWELH